ncbi:hypothetical protein M0811_01390 [Anaeramoeba ignava]|uniref:Transmembrane protein n=1 Tax=Anaeramoeba ignava TaxID=1746090 RepID=A0A9Q0LGQ3_ANAIG|nr:hypothetical protein M0811_01390 [Anaeramoeba ignava]
MKKFQLFFYSFFHLIILITQFSSVFSLNCPTKQEIEILLKTNIHIFESFVVPLNETGRSIKPILDEKQNSICQTEINQIPTRSPLNYRKNQALNLYNKTNSTFSIATFNSQLNCYSIADNQNGIKCLDSKISETISLCDFLPLMLIDKQSNEFQWINKFQTMESNIKTFSEDLTSKCQLIQSKNQIEMEIANLTIQNENETIKIILMNLENQVDSLNQQIDFLQNELMGQLIISFLIDEWQKANVSPFPNSSFENSQLSFNQLQNWFNNLTELLQGINAKEHESLFPFFKNNSDLFINSTMERLQMLNLSIPEKDLIYLETETALSVVSFHLFLATFNALGVSIQNGVNTENYTDFRDRIDGIQEILDSVEQIFQKLQSKNCSCLSTKISELQLINFKITDNDEAIYENNTNKGKIYESKLTGIFSCKLIEEMQQNKQVSFDFDTIYPMKIIDKIEVGRVCDDDSTITILVPYNSYPTNNTIIDLNKFDGNNRVFNLSKRIEQTLNSEEYPILTDQEQSKNLKI